MRLSRYPIILFCIIFPTLCYADDIEELQKAIKMDDLIGVQQLLNIGVDVNVKGSIGIPLHIASHKGNLVIVKMLLDKGASVNVIGVKSAVDSYLVLR